MIVYTWPDTFGVEALHLRIVPNTRGFTSPFTRQAQFARLEGARWVADLELISLTFAEANNLSAFLHRLDGRTGSIAFHDPSRVTPAGNAAGGHVGAASDFSDGTKFSDNTQFADGSDFGQLDAVANRDDDTIVIRGLVPSVTAFEPGDLLQLADIHDDLGSQLLEVQDQAQADATGKTRVVIRPRLRRSHPAGTQITFREPKGVFRLASDTLGQPRRRHVIAEGHALQFIENV